MLVCFALPACSKGPAQPIDFVNSCKIENDKKYVEISGYLNDKGGIFCSNTGGRMDCGFTLNENLNGGNEMRVDIEQGSGSNEIEKLESGYRRSDIKLHDNSGSVISLSDKVRITGEMNVLPDGKFCFIEVSKIER
jgi:hypothetical protein